MAYSRPTSAGCTGSAHRLNRRNMGFIRGRLHFCTALRWFNGFGPCHGVLKLDQIKGFALRGFLAPDRMGERRNLMLVQLNTECSISTRCSPSLLSPRAVFLGSSSGYRRGVSRYAGYSANREWVRRLGPASVLRCGVAAIGARTLSKLLSPVLLLHVDISS